MSMSEMFSMILYGMIGVVGALSIIQFVRGFLTYITRLGTDRRDDGLKIMEWGVALVMTLIILIAILNLLKRWYPAFQ
jgi:hypothetical protein